MIERVTVENYRSIASVDVELGKLNVLVGRNGAGKSTFIDVLRLIRDALRFNLETAIDQRGGIASLCRWTASGRSLDIQIGIETDLEGLQARHNVTFGRAPQSGYRVKREVAVARYYPNALPDGSFVSEPIVDEFEVLNSKWLKGMPTDIGQFLNSFGDYIYVDPQLLLLATPTGEHKGLSRLRLQLQHTTFYTIFPNTLREPQKHSSETRLNDRAENLGSALKQIITQEPNFWKRDLIAAMRKLVGDIVDVRVRSIGGYVVTELKHETAGKKEKWFNLSQESDGTLRMLGLLVALYQDPPPSLIVIEEPELTIHPGALGVLCDILREASERTQILVTTQSPDLVSYFKADEIRVVERVDGVTEIGMIDETQRVAIDKHLFNGGELLRMEGLKREVPHGEAVSA